MADATTWQSEADSLALIFKIGRRVPTTSANNRFSIQATELVSQVSMASDSAIFIGHSNGGLVGRVANAASPYNARPWRGLVTVGSPHHGAQLMESAVTGAVSDWTLGVSGDVAQAVLYYWNTIAPNEVVTAILQDEDIYALMGDVIGDLATLGFSVLNPVSVDMVPGSDILDNTLNAPANLTREASAMPIRVGIRSTLPSNYGLIWKGLIGSGWGSARNVQSALEAAFEVGYVAAIWYEDDEDPAHEAQIRNGAYLLLYVAEDLENMDDDYCFLMGAWELNHCGASDGIVPLAAQAYPGAQLIDVTGPSHREEARSSEVDLQLKSILSNQFGVPTYPPPSWADIVGTGVMRPGNTCYWYATTNVTSPNYQWSVDGNVVGTSSDLYYSASYDFTLTLQVWNLSDGASAYHFVSVSNDNNDCAMERPTPARRPSPGTTGRTGTP